VRAPEVRLTPSTAPSHVTRSSPAAGRVREGLFFAAWAAALTVASVVAAVVYAVGSPIAAATVEYQRRQYR
jgi:hypothetical protein